MLLLCALMAGSGSVWADKVTFDATTDVTANAQSYQTTEKTYTASDGSEWIANGYGATAKTNIIIGKGGANYLKTPEVNGTITSVAVTWSGNTSYYLALQTTSGTELEAKSNPSTATEQTFTVSGEYSQLRLVGRRSSGTSNAAATITKVVVTYTPADSGDKEDCDLELTGSPIELEFDLYNDVTKVISYTTSSTGAVTVDKSDYVDAVVDEESKTITLTAKKTTNSAQTVTVNQASDDDYKSGSATFTVSITDSTPFVGGDVTFVGGTDKGSTSANNSPDEVEKSVVTISSTDAAMATAQYRLYSGSTTTISTTSGKITKIVFTPDGTYSTSNLSVASGSTGTYSGGTWTGSATSVAFSASAQFRASQIVVTVSPTVTLAASGYASYCSPFTLDLTPTDDYAAYAVTATSGSSVTFSKIEGAVPAETPFILFGKDMGGEIVCLPITTGETTAVSGNMLRGTLAETAITTISGDYTNFGLSNGSFVKISDGTLPANKAYLPILTANVPSNARLSIIFEDETTGISNVESHMMNVEGYYNLAGQKVAQPTKGLYIVNGKKVIIK